MKKTILFFVFALSIYSASSQSFMHGAGVGFLVSNPSNADTKVFATLHYYPQVAFVQTGAFSVSAGIPLTVGLTGSYNAGYSSNGGSYEENTLLGLIQVPLMVNFNGGAGSSKENEQRVGYFIGGGFGYHSTGIGEFDDKKHYTKGFGPAANAGLRFAVGSHQKNIEARLSYMKGLKDFKPSMFGLNAAFNF
ncbi:MAG: hypothetical protein M9904_08105 [Chitinophagaceae bacterium]|nr:hypothetical protein [Chitinophagaceae bacterium]